MRYQLVLQFPAASIDNFDQLAILEEKLIEKMGDLATVDGHDFGQSEFNIFLVTHEPAMAFERAHGIVRGQGFEQNMRAAYRDLSNERYVILWPATLTHFVVL